MNPPAASYLRAFPELQTHFIEICEIRKSVVSPHLSRRRRRLVDLFGFTIKSPIDTFRCRNYSERRRQGGCSRSNKLGLRSSCSQMLQEDRMTPEGTPGHEMVKAGTDSLDTDSSLLSLQREEGRAHRHVSDINVLLNPGAAGQTASISRFKFEIINIIISLLF